MSRGADAPTVLAIHDDPHEYARRDLELAHDEDVARASLIVDEDVHVLRIIIGMTDDPRARRDLGARPFTLHWRRLVAWRAVGIPNAAFAGWGIVALGDVEPPRRMPGTEVLGLRHFRVAAGRAVMRGLSNP